MSRWVSTESNGSSRFIEKLDGKELCQGFMRECAKPLPGEEKTNAQGHKKSLR